MQALTETSHHQDAFHAQQIRTATVNDTELHTAERHCRDFPSRRSGVRDSSSAYTFNGSVEPTAPAGRAFHASKNGPGCEQGLSKSEKPTLSGRRMPARSSCVDSRVREVPTTQGSPWGDAEPSRPESVG